MRIERLAAGDTDMSSPRLSYYQIERCKDELRPECERQYRRDAELVPGSIEETTQLELRQAFTRLRQCSITSA